MRSSKRDAAATGGTKPKAGLGAVIGAGTEREAVAAAANRKSDAAATGGWTEVRATSEVLGEAPGVAADRAVRLR